VSCRPEQNSGAREAGAGKVSEAQVERGPVTSVGILRKDKAGPFQGPWKQKARKARLTLKLEADGCTFPVGEKLKTEILVDCGRR
jgi:hypothetical protein